LQARFADLIVDVRHSGAMIARPNPELTQAIIQSAASHGLVLLACGFYGNVIRFLPALTMSDEVANEGLDCFDSLLTSLISTH